VARFHRATVPHLPYRLPAICRFTLTFELFQHGCDATIQATLSSAADPGATILSSSGLYFDTFESGAAQFYERCGFSRFGQINDFPPGFARAFLYKKLPMLTVDDYHGTVCSRTVVPGRPTDDQAQKATRLIRAVEKSSQSAANSPSTQSPVFNAGLSHSMSDGSFITGDLCSSRKPLDRDLLFDPQLIAVPFGRGWRLDIAVGPARAIRALAGQGVRAKCTVCKVKPRCWGRRRYVRGQRNSGDVAPNVVQDQAGRRELSAST
jgi:hypothetical protein